MFIAMLCSLVTSILKCTFKTLHLQNFKHMLTSSQWVRVPSCDLQKQWPGGSLQKKCSWKFRKFHKENTYTRVFLLKLHPGNQQLYWKRDSGTSVFPWILWNFKRYSHGTQGFLYWKNSLKKKVGCFWRF